MFWGPRAVDVTYHELRNRRPPTRQARGLASSQAGAGDDLSPKLVSLSFNTLISPASLPSSTS